MAKPKNRLGVIWIDAHADLHSPYTTPSGNMHGMPLATALVEDNIENQVHYPDEKTVTLWNQLKNIGKITPKIRPEDIVFIALRDFEKEEEHIIKKYNIKVNTVQEVRRKGVENVVRQTLMHLSNCDDIYVSFDVDCLDSSISRGTGTPVSNGLREREAEDMLASLMQNHKICCFEITEVNPTLDKENLLADQLLILFFCIQYGLGYLRVLFRSLLTYHDLMKMLVFQYAVNVVINETVYFFEWRKSFIMEYFAQLLCNKS